MIEHHLRDKNAQRCMGGSLVSRARQDSNQDCLALHLIPLRALAFARKKVLFGTWKHAPHARDR
jgi:hypothetical protein